MPTTVVSYHIREHQHVRLDVLIGDGQAGGSAAYLGTLCVHPGPDISDLLLGTGDELIGVALVVSSTVVDVRPEHDRTSVQVVLRGGDPIRMPIEQSAEANRSGAVNYLTVVRFVP